MSFEYNTFTELAEVSEPNTPLPLKGDKQKLLFSERFKGKISKMKNGDMPIFGLNANTPPIQNFLMEQPDMPVQDPQKSNSNLVSISPKSALLDANNNKFDLAMFNTDLKSEVVKQGRKAAQKDSNGKLIFNAHYDQDIYKRKFTKENKVNQFFY